MGRTERHAHYEKKRENTRKTKTFIKYFLSFCLIACIIAGVAGSIYAVTIIKKAPKIEPKKINEELAVTSIVYDDDGKKLTKLSVEDRTLVKYEDLNQDTINAFVAIEDKTFWKHHGFNFKRMIGAVVKAAFNNGSISGTSTITQQLARNVYLPEVKSERSIKRKVLEMYYAHCIEQELSKEEIVTAYLNSIYLGFGCYGIDSASHTYFSKKPSKLTVQQAAALAALPQAPDTYALIKYVENADKNTKNIVLRKNGDTYVANDISKDRRDLCLALMKEQKYIDNKTYEAAADKKLISFIKPKISVKKDEYGYFTDYLTDKIAEDIIAANGCSEEEAYNLIYTGGLKIYSTIDRTAQKVVTKEFKNSYNFPYLYYSRNQDGDIISTSGTILLYNHDKHFSKNGDFKLPKSEYEINKDKSVTIYNDNFLKIYPTESASGKDCSVEFSKTYINDNGSIYSYAGGYINIPAEYKKYNSSDGSVTISGEFLENNKETFKVSKKSFVVTNAGYTLPQKNIQPEAAMAIVEVGTGEVKALVGGRSNQGGQLYNRALNARQPGSSIKPLSVYSAALQKSFEYAGNGQKFPLIDTGHDKQGTKLYGDYLTASSIIVDEAMTFNGKSWPSNAGGGHRGRVTMRKALQQSINTCAVKIQLQVGNDYSMRMLDKYGLTTIVKEGESNDSNPAALALGGLTKGVTPLEMAQAYATFPNNGVRCDSIAYTKVVDRDGSTILTGEAEKTKVIDEGVAWIMTDMLKSVVSSGLGYPATVYGVSAGGKTGTTSSQYDIWFDGFTPTYSASLWIGCDVNIEMSSMSETAARLWGRIMNQIPKAKTGAYKSMPGNVVYINGEYYTQGTEVIPPITVEEKEDDENESSDKDKTENSSDNKQDDNKKDGNKNKDTTKKK